MSEFDKIIGVILITILVLLITKIVHINKQRLSIRLTRMYTVDIPNDTPDKAILRHYPTKKQLMFYWIKDRGHLYQEQRKAYVKLAQLLYENDPRFDGVNRIETRSLVIRYKEQFGIGEESIVQLNTLPKKKVSELRCNQAVLMAQNVANWSYKGFKRIRKMWEKQYTREWKVSRQEFVDYFQSGRKKH